MSNTELGDWWRRRERDTQMHFKMLTVGGLNNEMSNCLQFIKSSYIDPKSLHAFYLTEESRPLTLARVVPIFT